MASLLWQTRLLSRHWRLQGVLLAPPPPTGPNSFVFAYIFTESARIGGQRPRTGNPGSATVQHCTLMDMCTGMQDILVLWDLEEVLSQILHLISSAQMPRQLKTISKPQHQINSTICSRIPRFELGITLKFGKYSPIYKYICHGVSSDVCVSAG